MKLKRHRNHWLRPLQYIAALPLLAFAAPCAGAETLDYLDLPPEQLLQIEVTSVSKRPEKLVSAPAAIYVVTAEDIARSGAQTISDALRHVPGVQVAQADSNSAAVSIRGFNSVLANKLLVMIDGRTVYNPVFGGTFWEIQDVVMEDIDRIEVIRGPGGTLWGANAVNGVINIITRNARQTQGGLVSGGIGNEMSQLTTRYGGAAGDNFYRLYARQFSYDGSRQGDGSGASHDAWSGRRAGFRMDNDRLTVQGDAYRIDTDQLRNDFSLTVPYSVTREQTLEYGGGNLLTRWQDDLDDGSDINVLTYLDYTRRDEPYNFIDNRLTYDLEVQYNFAPTARHEISVGSGYRLLVTNQKNTPDTILMPTDRNDQVFSMFAQDKITLAPDSLYLTLGSKFEHNDFSGFEVQPNARLQWLPDDHQTVWGAISRAVRTPTPLETDVFSVLGAGPAIEAALRGNPDFKSEELTAYEIGYRNQVNAALSFDAAAFYNVYDRLATLALLPNETVNDGVNPPYTLIPIEFRNDMSGRSYGLELAANWKVSPELQLKASYSYMRLMLDATDTAVFPQEGAEDLYPPQQFSVGASWDVTDSLSLNTDAYYVDELKGDDVGDYLRLDMNVEYRINDNVRFNLIGQNLLDSSHREFDAENGLNAGEVQRSIYGKLTWTF